MLAAFPIGFFIIGAIIMLGLPIIFSLQSYFDNRGRRSAICPDNHQRVDVEVDRKFSFWTAWRGKEHTRLQFCSRWPEKGDCGQECLIQVDPTPENIERYLALRNDGKACGMCGILLTPRDWRQGRLGLLDENLNLVEMRNIEMEQLPFLLEKGRPLCWNCHQEEREHQARPHRVLKGERTPVLTAVED